MLRHVARRYGKPDPDELESALTVVLAKVHPKKTVVDNWPVFLRVALRNAALNWLRAQTRRTQRISNNLPSPLPGELDVILEHFAAVTDVNPDDALALERVRGTLAPFLLAVWDAMIAQGFDQSRVAPLLGVHRSTIRRALRQIALVLKEHGF